MVCLHLERFASVYVFDNQVTYTIRTGTSGYEPVRSATILREISFVASKKCLGRRQKPYKQGPKEVCTYQYG